MNEPVSSCRKKVDATVDSAVRYWPLAVYMQLFFEVLFILLVDILHNGLPTTDRQVLLRGVTELFIYTALHISAWHN